MVASGTSRSIPFQPHIGTDKPSLAIRSKSFGQLSHGYIGIEWEHFAETWRHQNLEKKWCATQSVENGSQGTNSLIMEILQGISANIGCSCTICPSTTFRLLRDTAENTLVA